MTVLEAINEYKKCIDEIAQLLFVFASVIGYDRVEAGHLTQLGWTIGEVKGYHTGIMRYDPVKRIKDAIIGDMPDKKELQKRLAYVWHELSEEVAFIEDEETGYFPVFDEKNFSLDNKELFNVLCKLESKNYAFTVLTHLEGVVHWTNTRISEVYKMLCELSDFAGMTEQEKVAVKLGNNDKKQETTAESQQYDENLLKLFHNNTDLIDELKVLSDNEIAGRIKQWCKERDKFGKPRIENPDNGYRSAFSNALKEAGIIKCASRTFIEKLNKYK